MPTRGTYEFQLDNKGKIADNESNLEKLRQLFRDGRIIDGDWGPGDDGDFDNGSWHILCHLAGGSGIMQTEFGVAWYGMTHIPAIDSYQASLVCQRNGAPVVVSLAGEEGSRLTTNAQCLGYLEGSSIGHITARGINDPPHAFNGWPRQRFDKESSSDEDGGTVWEHWCTTRDIRPSSAIGSAVLQAYLTLVSLLGGWYVAALARGRREHDHPKQLAALVTAGLLTVEEATWDISPEPVPLDAQDLLYEARPADVLRAVELLPIATGEPKYFMFKRRIDRWSQADAVRRDLKI